MKLNDVNSGIHANTKRLRVGRGPGSGRGRYAGRGNKGQGQLAGWSAAGIFEGGGMPLIRRIPKRGFHNAYGRIVKAVNVAALQEVFAAGAEVTPQTLRTSGLAKGIWDEIKILGNGELALALVAAARRAAAAGARPAADPQPPGVLVDALVDVVELHGSLGVGFRRASRPAAARPRPWFATA